MGFSLKGGGGGRQSDTTEIMVEMNLYFSGRKVSKAPIVYSYSYYSSYAYGVPTEKIIFEIQ